MNQITISQPRVCDHLRAAGYPLRKKDDREFFLKHYESVAGLTRLTTKQISAKNGQGSWYVYETIRYLDVSQAEKEIADQFAACLGLKM